MGEVGGRVGRSSVCDQRAIRVGVLRDSSDSRKRPDFLDSLASFANLDVNRNPLDVARLIPDGSRAPGISRMGSFLRFPRGLFQKVEYLPRQFGFVW